ncbi:hypothetical protein CYMTET_23658 [Cymbomonas tetramitiformis]|uniref:Uncharacterized protein n=1 Tax=Cymbomonas tetramitiformis TaxID=36881 RepID=A0AAE0L122_9CHLO|nr:hypothetical protein CYMTET_23658 [Cymbomonas tetramitiformis]
MLETFNNVAYGLSGAQPQDSSSECINENTVVVSDTLRTENEDIAHDLVTEMITLVAEGAVAESLLTNVEYSAHNPAVFVEIVSYKVYQQDVVQEEEEEDASSGSHTFMFVAILASVCTALCVAAFALGYLYLKRGRQHPEEERHPLIGPDGQVQYGGTKVKFEKVPFSVVYQDIL